jgi:hypothetical protein
MWLVVGSAALTVDPRCEAQIQNTVNVANGTMGIPIGTLAADGWFGHAIVDLGDLGPMARTSHALAIGAWDDADQGAVWIAFIRDQKTSASDPAAGTVESLVKITEDMNGFSFTLSADVRFGHSLAHLGDIDGDGSTEIAIGTPRDDTGGQDVGAVWIVSLNPDGTVKQKGVPSTPQVVKIGDNIGGFPDGLLDADDEFGISLGTLPDLDGNGVPELAVGAHHDDEPVDQDAGAVYILFLAPDRTVHHVTKVGDDGTPTSPLLVAGGDLFGESVQYLGVVAKQHVLAVGAILDNSKGAVWLIPIASSGTIAGTPKKIGDGIGGLPFGTLLTLDRFGHSLAPIGDRDEDGTPDLAVGANNDDAGGVDAGAVYCCFLNGELTVKSFYKITEGQSGFPSSSLDDHDHFATVAPIGDFDGNGIDDLAVGAFNDDTGGSLDAGSVWLLKLNQYGHGCPGSCGIAPVLAASTAGTAGSTIRFDLSNAFGGPVFATLVAGIERTSLPMGAGCTLYVLPTLTVLNTTLGGNGCGNGEMALATTIPAGIGGTTLLFQAFAADPGAMLGFTGSNGVAIHFVP